MPGKADDTPEKLDTPGKRALYNNLSQNEELALRIDDAVRNVRPMPGEAEASRTDHQGRAVRGASG
jgi:hypothetical protein